jgi:hypothetical protein
MKISIALISILISSAAHALTTYPTGHWSGTGTQTTGGVSTPHHFELTITPTSYSGIYTNPPGTRHCEYNLDYLCGADGTCVYSQGGVQKGTGYCVGNHCSMTGLWSNSCQAPISGTMNFTFNSDGTLDRFGSNGTAPTLLVDHSAPVQ